MKIKITKYPENILVYKDQKNEWRWTIKANNGRLIGASSEGYKNKKDCEMNLAMVGNSIVNGDVFMQLSREEAFMQLSREEEDQKIQDSYEN